MENAVSQQDALLEATRGRVLALDDILALFAEGRADELSVFFCSRLTLLGTLLRTGPASGQNAFQHMYQESWPTST